MRITVRFFAIIRERAGVSSIELDLQHGATVDDAAQRIAEQFPAIATMLPRIAWAVNQVYADRTAALHDGDELALIPPVSGG
jgi:molybdopterin converting factor subunit 1